MPNAPVASERVVVRRDQPRARIEKPSDVQARRINRGRSPPSRRHSSAVSSAHLCSDSWRGSRDRERQLELDDRAAPHPAPRGRAASPRRSTACSVAGRAARRTPPCTPERPPVLRSSTSLWLRRASSPAGLISISTPCIAGVGVDDQRADARPPMSSTTNSGCAARRVVLVMVMVVDAWGHASWPRPMASSRACRTRSSGGARYGNVVLVAVGRRCQALGQERRPPRRACSSCRRAGYVDARDRPQLDADDVVEHPPAVREPGEVAAEQPEAGSGWTSSAGSRRSAAAGRPAPCRCSSGSPGRRPAGAR